MSDGALEDIKSTEKQSPKPKQNGDTFKTEPSRTSFEVGRRQTRKKCNLMVFISTDKRLETNTPIYLANGLQIPFRNLYDENLRQSVNVAKKEFTIVEGMGSVSVQINRIEKG
ncbi:CLUMA_CG015948, isoform A [Clunio marinus]|uniref:CLUMA_CG015948, isoform A n=1 Tax=Clunio marinus TaxID=568069 RepID=A0A1J1IU06_9DIPT|nr:CLUMA_CG015948, isoform A [Clunio marinus]